MGYFDKTERIEEFNGDVLESDCNLLVAGNVRANIIRVKGELAATGSITAAGDIHAESIHAEDGIIAGGNIICEDYILSKNGSIISGGSIESNDEYVSAQKGSITCPLKLSAKNISAQGIDCGQIESTGSISCDGILRADSIKVRFSITALVALYAQTVICGWAITCLGIKKVDSLRDRLQDKTNSKTLLEMEQQ